MANDGVIAVKLQEEVRGGEVESGSDERGEESTMGAGTRVRKDRLPIQDRGQRRRGRQRVGGDRCKRISSEKKKASQKET